jgi:Protein of unknown function (DUF4232)
MSKTISFRKTIATASVAVATTASVVFVGLAGSQMAQAKTVTTPRCLVNQLSTSMRAGSPGAGQRYAFVTLKNTSKVTCETGGYVGLGLTNSKDKGLPTHAIREDRKDATAIKLTPGEKATEQLQWGVIGGAGVCVKSAKHLLVTPPNDFHSFILPWKLGTVCESGRFFEMPLKLA